MSTVDTEWKQMLEIAKCQQQEYYELLADWMKYQEDEYKYLKQNIGFALFGPPSEDENANVTLNNQLTDDDMTNAFHYTPKAEKIRNIVYSRILEFGEHVEYNNLKQRKKFIFSAIIYNSTFRTKTKSANKKKDKKETKNLQNDDNDQESGINLRTTPIFKIRSVNDEQTWYIDINGRVYKSWLDYKKSNTLPKCTMVLPMDGCYQPDPNYKTTEECSTVWLEILESPACSLASNVLRGVDRASSAAGFIGLGLGVATLFTPAAPVAIGALVAVGANGIWSFGRATNNLVNRSKHEESISLLNRDAFCSWLTITGSTVGLVASGGGILLSKFAQSGSNIGTAARATYNTLLVSNLSINGVGILYQGYCMYERYREGQEIQTVDIVFFATHVLFFGNAVVNMQFAGDLIKSTQGKIFEDYRATLRSKNLRKKFNRAKRTAAANNVDKISENAEVIRFINRRKDLQINVTNNADNVGNFNAHSKSIIFLDNGGIKICGIALLDPMKFIKILLTLDQNYFRQSGSGMHENESSMSSENSDTEDMLSNLRDLLLKLLSKSRDAFKNVQIQDITGFNMIFNDIKYMKNGLKIFSMIFEIAVGLISQNEYCMDYLVDAIRFTWCYVRESLKQTCLTKTFSITDEQIQTVLTRIITVLFDKLDVTIETWSTAFSKYIREYLRMKISD